MLNRRVSVAPMMDWTDPHCRYFHRLLSRHVTLYTEMITTGALIYGERERFLKYHSSEHPVALQLGGSEPEALAQCAKMAEDAGYDEVNLNVGCPSDRVQSGQFGASLMAHPQRVADCVAAMKQAVAIPVTVKHRIGIDDLDSYALLHRFVDLSQQAGCDGFIVHARKAWLSGLSPKQNRDVPPLQYETVYQLKRDFPDSFIEINGGITDLAQVEQHLQHVDSVMIGREFYQNPYLLAQVDQLFYQAELPPLTRHQVLEALIDYIDQHVADGGRVVHVTRHIMGLFHGQPKGKLFRRFLSENACRSDATTALLREVMQQIPDMSLSTNVDCNV